LLQEENGLRLPLLYHVVEDFLLLFRQADEATMMATDMTPTLCTVTCLDMDKVLLELVTLERQHHIHHMMDIRNDINKSTKKIADVVRANRNNNYLLGATHLLTNSYLGSRSFL